MTIQVRPYSSPDRDAVIALWSDTLGDTAPHNDPALSLDKKLAWDPELLLVATERERVVGTVMGGYDGHRGWVYSLAVAPHCRRRGIGSTLLAALEAQLAQRGCLKINLQIRATNRTVVDFYASRGYAVEDRVQMGKRLYDKQIRSAIAGKGSFSPF